jgi:transmembrane sensor
MSVDNRMNQLAAKWARRLQGPELSETEREAFEKWFLADIAHADALAEACYIITAVGELSAEKRAEMLALPEGAAEEAEAVKPSASAATKGRPRWRAPYSLAASAAFAAILGVLGFVAVREGWLPRTYQTETAEVRVVTLPDGSAVHLNAETIVRWSGFSRGRRAELVAGQALFEVVHDATHPFVVRADSGLVRVLGTKFDLNRRSDSTVLTVLEGAVEVSNGDGTAAHGRWHRIVYANQRLAYVSAGPISDVRQVDASRAVRWREFSLDLDQEPLSAVIEELSRYTNQQIVVRDRQLSSHRVSGGLQVRDIREALRDLEIVAPVVVSQDGGAFVVDLRASDPPRGDAGAKLHSSRP